MKHTLIYIAFFLILFYSCKKDDDFKPISVQNLDNYSISSITFDMNNDLWIGTDTGLFKSSTSGYELIDIGTSNQITTLAFEKDNNSLWIGTTDGIYQLNASNSDYIIVPVAIDKLSNITIQSAYIDDYSVKWFGTETGFTRNTDDKWQKDQFKINALGAVTNLQFHDFAVNSIAVYDGDYFFATAGNKLWRATGWDSSVDAFTGATMWDTPYNGFGITDTMYVVFIDSQGVQWFGGKDGVQVHVGHEPVVDNYSYKEELIDLNVHCIAEAPNSDIWCGTENGISIFNGTSWKTSSAVLANNFVTTILFDGNKAWIGTKKGLFSIDY